MRDVTFTLDGQRVTTPAGTTILRAATKAGIYIPNLCDGPGLEPYGACRLCIVEIEGLRGMPTACTVKATEGMQVRSDVDAVNQVRRITCELLIADHPDDCLTCSGNQSCALQRVSSYLGIDERRLRTMVRSEPLDESNPFFTRDMSKCILCGLCTRACHEIRAVDAIEFAGRGHASTIAAGKGGPITDSTCVSCGECVDRCPTNALSAKQETRQADREIRTTCVYCGVGCGLLVGVRGQHIVHIKGDAEHRVNRGSLCVKGRFGLDFVGATDRLMTPLIKHNGGFRPASWDEALDLVATKMRDIKATHGPDALAGLSSAKCTNEENYLFQKFMRATIGTNNVDHCARLCHASTVAGLARAFGSGAMTNSSDELEFADCIFVTGSNTTEAHPVIALKIKAAVRKHGATLIVADPRRIGLTDFADLHIRQRSGTDVALFNAMMHVIIADGLHNEAFIQSRTEAFESVRDCVATCSPEWAEAITGIAADDIRQAARLYARAKRGSIVYSMGITQHTTGTDNVLALANLAMLTGHIGRESTGVNPLRGQNNVQGACDLGALPNVFPGYQKVDDPAVRQKFEKAWGTPLSGEVGLTLTEIVNGAETGDIKGLYVMGENPMLSDPNLNHVEKALKQIDFLCVQDLFLTETAQLADVVLPSGSFLEKNGTFTNTERRVQRVRKAFEPIGDSRADWEIIADLSERLGYPMSYAEPSAILDEAASVTPLYGGITYDRIDEVGLQWPCPDTGHPGTVYLHAETFTRGLGKFHATPFREAAEPPDHEYPYLLTTGRYLYHWHTRTMTGRSPGLETLCPPVPIEIHPTDAKRDGFAEGDRISISSRRGTIRATACLTDRSPRGTVFMAFHFAEGAANVLTIDSVDPIAKIPEYKICAVKLSRDVTDAACAPA